MLRSLADHLSPPPPPPPITAISTMAAAAAAAAAADSASTSEIDATVWRVVSAAVAANDLEGMAAVYHPDAVLVDARTGTIALAEQLPKWGWCSRGRPRPFAADPPRAALAHSHFLDSTI